MTVAAASALAPQLNHRPRDPRVETSALAAIAIWATQFTPVISLEPPAGLLLEIEGSLKLLGGIDNVLQSVERGLHDMGYTAAIACASTATAAWLLARNGGSRVAVGRSAPASREQGPAERGAGTRLRDATAKPAVGASVIPALCASPGSDPKGNPLPPCDAPRLRDATDRESGAAPSSAGVASVSGVTSPEGAPVPPFDGALEPVIAALPVAVLDCDAVTRTTFAAIGAKRIGDLLRLPRDGLARRFGPRLLDTLDRALGKLPEARRSFTPPERFDVKLELAAEVTHSEALLFAAKRQLTQLAGFLAARGAGIQYFTFTLLHEVQNTTVTEIGLVAPTRDLRHLVALTRERLAALALRAPVRALQLTAGDICALAAENYSLFQDSLNAQGEWQQLVERLRARLGQDAVHGISARPDHRPEHAWYATQPGTRNMATEARPRPLWLLEPPQPLRAIASKPHYRNDALALIAGPERIESGWWDGADARRDYFIAQTPACATLWIYRERREPFAWYLHGVFG